MSLSDTTNEILVSEDPCAIAMMFTFSRPTELNVRAGNARRAAHVFADHGDDRDIRIERDVLHFFVRHVLREFLAQRFDGRFGLRRRTR